MREEYRHVPPQRYRQRRLAVLRAFAGRDRIYRTAWFSARCEQAARGNLDRSLARLEASGGET